MKLLYTLLLLMTLAATAQSPGSITIKKVADFDVKESPDKTWEAASWVEVPQRSDNGVTYATKAKVL